MNMLEAFRALNALNEDVFDMDAEGIQKLSDFKQNDDFEDDISIIDPEAETEEDLQDNYIGKVILDCCVCHSKLYKSKEEVTVDETGELANVGEECPYCFTPDGFKVIGEVAAFKEEEVEEGLLGTALAAGAGAYVGNKLADGLDRQSNNGSSIKEGLLGDVNVSLDARGLGGKDNNVSVLGGRLPMTEDNEEVEEGLLGTALAAGAGAYVGNKLADGLDRRASSDDSVKEGIFGFGKKKKLAAEKARKEAEEKRRQEEEDEERRERIRQQNVIDSHMRYDKSKRDAEREYARTRYNSIQADRPSNTGYRGVNYSGGDYYESLDKSKESPIAVNESAISNDLASQTDDFTKSSGYVICVGTEDKDAAVKELHKHYVKVEAAHMSANNSFKVSYSNPKQSTKGALDESIEDFSMTANDTHVEVGEDENGKVTVTMEPVTADGGEMIAPVSPETEMDIMGGEDEIPAEDVPEDEVDVDLEEVDEESMDELGESYFRRVYENVKTYKTTGVKSRGNNLIVEGKIKFDSGKVKKTSFVFESLDMTKGGKVRFVGDNKQLTEGKKAFTLTGRVEGKKLIAESMNYNYRQKDASGKSTRVYGTERISRRK